MYISKMDIPRLVYTYTSMVHCLNRNSFPTMRDGQKVVAQHSNHTRLTGQAHQEIRTDWPKAPSQTPSMLQVHNIRQITCPKQITTSTIKKSTLQCLWLDRDMVTIIRVGTNTQVTKLSRLSNTVVINSTRRHQRSQCNLLANTSITNKPR